MSNKYNNNNNDEHDDLNQKKCPPIIDLSTPETEEVVKQIADACSEFGFFQVTSPRMEYLWIL